ncbi:MAG: PAS domain S-box protein [Anaerolineae bacterium]|nr:PAS domain S-box protein [Anaerolineae bacterium]
MTHFSIAFNSLIPGDHIAHLYEYQSERDTVLKSFLRDGLKLGEKILYITPDIIPDARFGQSKALLATLGISDDHLLQPGQFSVLPVSEVLQGPESFSFAALIRRLEQEATAARQAGYSDIRIVDNRSWILSYKNRTFNFERELERWTSHSRCTLLCLYNRLLFPPAVLLDVLRTHFHIVLGVNWLDNHYYIPPHIAPQANGQATELQSWLHNLIEQPTPAEKAEHFRATSDLLRRRNWELALLNRATRILSSTLDIEQLYFTILEEVRNLMQVLGASIWLLSPDRQELICAYATGLGRKVVQGWRMEVSRGIAGWVARSGQSLIVSDVMADDRYSPDVSERAGLLLRSILCVPLLVKREIIGVLQIVDEAVNRFTETDLTLIEPLAATAAIAIENARLYEETAQLRSFNENIVQGMLDGIILKDINDIITFVNPQAAAMLGYEPEELVGMFLMDIIAPAFIEKVKSEMRNRIAGIPGHYEAALLAKDKRVIPVVISAHPLFEGDRFVGALGVFTDITEQKQVEMALRESQGKLQGFLENSRDGVVLCDELGKIIEWSLGQEKITGLKYAAVVNRPIGEVMLEISPVLQQNPEIIIQVKSQLCRLQVTGEAPWLNTFKETEVLHSDGRMLVLQSLVFPIPTEQGFMLGCICRDITSQKLMQAKMAQADRHMVTGKLAAALAHQINNPLQSVLGFLGLATEALDPDSPVTRYLDVAQQNVRRIAELVSRLNNFYQVESDAKVSVQINVLLEEVIELTRIQREELGIMVLWQPDLDLPEVTVEPEAISQLCLNLLLNAMEAMPGGGQIFVRTTHTEVPPGIKIVFIDKGIGIPGEVLPHIFEPFYSTKPRSTGLGLTISSNIVQNHNGKIEVETQEGVGSTFTVWLPAGDRLR